MKGSTLDLAERFSVKAKSSENAPVGRFPWNAPVARSAAGVPTGTPAVDLALALAAKSKAEPLPRRRTGPATGLTSFRQGFGGPP